METVDFLCGIYEKSNFVYAIKNNESDWHYFEEMDSLFEVHVSLPTNLMDKISNLVNKPKPITLTLNADQISNYVKDGKFVFKGKELKTYIQLSVKFLKMFEQCSDIKTEKDKLFKLRCFVNEDDKPEFSKLYFEGDWQTAKSKFLQKYSMEFTQNKKKDLDFGFDQETGLRSFVARKMDALSVYTTLSLENQLEVILSELPNEIANTFIVEDKLSSTKDEILEFCDVIEEFCDDATTETPVQSTPTTDSDLPSSFVQNLEIFNFEESSDTGSTSAVSRGRVGRGRKRLSRAGRTGRPPKIPRTISEESIDSFSSQTS